MSRVGTVKRTGHWVARIDGPPRPVYLCRRSTGPALVWVGRDEASSFRTKREAMDAACQSSLMGSLHGMTFENVAMTYAGFSAWRQED